MICFLYFHEDMHRESFLCAVFSNQFFIFKEAPENIFYTELFCSLMYRKLFFLNSVSFSEFNFSTINDATDDISGTTTELSKPSFIPVVLIL